MVPIHWKIEVYEQSDNWPKTHIEFPDVSDSDFGDRISGLLWHHSVEWTSGLCDWPSLGYGRWCHGGDHRSSATDERHLRNVQGKEPERYEQQIEKALIFGKQAFDRVFESELLEADVITNLKKQVSGYQDLRNPILAKNEEFQEYD